MIDLVVYRADGKAPRHRINFWWYHAHKWLHEVEATFKEKTTEMDYIDVQVYTWQDMPVDYGEFKTFAEAHEFLKAVLAKAKAGGYPGAYCPQ